MIFELIACKCVQVSVPNFGVCVFFSLFRTFISFLVNSKLSLCFRYDFRGISRHTFRTECTYYMYILMKKKETNYPRVILKVNLRNAATYTEREKRKCKLSTLNKSKICDFRICSDSVSFGLVWFDLVCLPVIFLFEKFVYAIFNAYIYCIVYITLSIISPISGLEYFTCTDTHLHMLCVWCINKSWLPLKFDCGK